jgi:hypothetical protein
MREGGYRQFNKESIRRMAKMRVGTMKTARPGQLELDRLVGEIVNKRGPGSASVGYFGEEALNLEWMELMNEIIE